MLNQHGWIQNMSHHIDLACDNWSGVGTIAGVHSSQALASRDAPMEWSLTCGF